MNCLYVSSHIGFCPRVFHIYISNIKPSSIGERVKEIHPFCRRDDLVSLGALVIARESGKECCLLTVSHVLLKPGSGEPVLKFVDARMGRILWVWICNCSFYFNDLLCDVFLLDNHAVMVNIGFSNVI